MTVRPEVPSEGLTLETPTGTLHGTLLLPQSPTPVPVALIIAGSGPTDRDGNSPLIPGSNDSLKLLAEALAARGIASVRYDKGGVGQSFRAGPDEQELRFDFYVGEAVLWAERLRADRRFSSLTIVGHSEGALVGMLAARRTRADAFASVAGVGRRPGEAVLEQLRPGLGPELGQRAEAVVKSLSRGERVEELPPQLATFFRPSIQPYMISWFSHDPAVEIAKLECPVLIAQGTTDIQVTVEDARLLAKARPSARLLIVEGMNHVLKEVPADPVRQAESYGDPSLPVVPALAEAVSQLVREADAQN